ncbi:hypothetical protein FA95DRAFT_1558979 [Auriscalpium vulgare]|uniref:Uncharacterized protein n=1 Tax=Auriscalpium vulgare TaxID=40419 RepID=A0ACB8RTQ6_9AGAM|nr:hypothetical protein FA95DRAFT_1558979 [Auriscalpium vulgare]
MPALLCSPVTTTASLRSSLLADLLAELAPSGRVLRRPDIRSRYMRCKLAPSSLTVSRIADVTGDRLAVISSYYARASAHAHAHALSTSAKAREDLIGFPSRYYI